MNLKNKPYNLFLLFSILFTVTGFFFYNRIIDIHLHDTYFVLQHAFLFWWGVAIFLFLWGICWATKQILYSNKLLWMHVVFTIAAVSMICMLPFLNHPHAGLAGTPRRYYDAESAFLKVMKEFSGIGFGIVLFFLSQVILLINLLLRLFLKKRTTKLK